MPRGSVRCSKRSRIATASWSAPKADPEAFRQNGLFHWLERVYPSARASLASERSAARLAHRSGGAMVMVFGHLFPSSLSSIFANFRLRGATALNSISRLFAAVRYQRGYQLGALIEEFQRDLFNQKGVGDLKSSRDWLEPCENI